MKRAAGLLALALAIAPAGAAPVLPAHLAGAWSTQDALFDGDTLVGGTAVYLGADGIGAIVAGARPARPCAEGACPPVVGLRVRTTLQGDTVIATILDKDVRSGRIVPAPGRAGAGAGLRPRHAGIDAARAGRRPGAAAAQQRDSGRDAADDCRKMTAAGVGPGQVRPRKSLAATPS